MRKIKYRMIKKRINTIYERNQITERIIDTLINKKNFVICGHENPDEDCVSSMVAFAILLTKFDKMAQIYLDGNINANLNYLITICKYNSIKIINHKSNIRKDIDVMVICDTAKRSMLDINSKLEHFLNNEDVIKIEIDHHTGSDSEYIGDPEYSLVDEASSASELVGFIALKLRNKKNLLMQYYILDPFSRNFILAVLTGIVGDTNMGRYVKSKREKKYYDIFSMMYNEMLMKLTVKETNLNKIEDVSSALQRLTKQEEDCYNYIRVKKLFSKSIGYVILDKPEMEKIYNEYDYDVLITVVKHVADELAEESDKLSMVVFYDNHEGKDLFQFRTRRSFGYKSLDLRKILEDFNISDGGGHEGAIGFRFPADSIDDITEYTKNLISKIEKIIEKKYAENSKNIARIK